MKLWHCLAAPLALASLLPAPARAEWPYNPLTNVPVCTAVGDQTKAAMVSDGAGGAIIAWQDFRNGNWNIYAQHLLASGAEDPQWPADGRILCAAAGAQVNPSITTDGAGGAIVAWQDYRTGTSDIYAQRVLASGSVDASWSLDGTALCVAANDQHGPVMASDGTGGAIVTWNDRRNGNNNDIYAQHILPGGVVDALWPVGGRALSIAANDQSDPAIVADGLGGAVVSWADARSGNIDIYAQRVLAGGDVDPAWPANGRGLCTFLHEQSGPTMVSDGGSGAIVAWHDGRSGSWKIYSQRVLSGGAVDPSWPENGCALAQSAGEQVYPVMIEDGTGGAIVAWRDLRTSNYNVYAQRVLATGVVDPGWPVEGRALYASIGNQDEPAIVADGASGAVIVWHDTRGGTGDIYAQRVLSNGFPDPSWPVDGVALSSAPGAQQAPAVASDGAGGAIVAWADYRGALGPDIYSQRIRVDGYQDDPAPRIVSIRDVPNDQGGKVKLSWKASYLDTAIPPVLNRYEIFRSVPPNVVSQRLSRGTPFVTSPSRTERPTGELLVTTIGDDSYYWESVATVTAVHFTSNYSYVAATTSDSLPDSNPMTAFMVVGYGATYHLSAPDSGYSVDNLSPPMPAPFVAAYSPGGVGLHWGRNAAPDFKEFLLYRGTGAAFVPGPGNLVVATPDTGHVDPTTQTFHYKLVAVDIHGNRSLVAVASPLDPVSSLVSLANVDAGPDRIRIAWYVPGNQGLRATVYRRTPATGWSAIGEIVADGSGYLRFEDLSVELRQEYGYRLGVINGDSEIFAGEVWTRSEPLALALEGAWPNPATGAGVRLHFTLPTADAARLDLIDVTGRRILSREVGTLGAGRHVVSLDDGVRLPAGIYLVRLTQGGRYSTTRVAIVE